MSLSHSPGTYLRPDNGTPVQTLPAAAYEKLKDRMNERGSLIVPGKA